MSHSKDAVDGTEVNENGRNQKHVRDAEKALADHKRASAIEFWNAERKDLKVKQNEEPARWAGDPAEHYRRKSEQHDDHAADVAAAQEHHEENHRQRAECREKIGPDRDIAQE